MYCGKKKRCKHFINKKALFINVLALFINASKILNVLKNSLYNNRFIEEECKQYHGRSESKWWFK